MCFQELFYGPYFCQVQDEVYFEYAESVPGPTVERFQQLARESRMPSRSAMSAAHENAALSRNVSKSGDTARRRSVITAVSARTDSCAAPRGSEGDAQVPLP